MALLELKIPPPLVAAVLAGAMYAASVLLPPVLALSPGLHVYAALALAGVGVFLDLAGIFAFRKAQTTVNPLTPQRSSTVVTNGIYGITRNPMYLGLGLILLGLAVYLASLWALLGPVLYVAFITRFQIQPEERALAARFGASYSVYCVRVRRWL